MDKNSGTRTKAVAAEETTKRKSDIVIREIEDEELASAANLVARLKRLNGEFDPILKTSEKVEAHSLEILKEAMGRKDSVVLVAVIGTRIVGVTRADVIDRVFYEPRMEGAIVEFYILPEYRRGGLGNDLLSQMSKRLEEKGAEMITAEFPSQNEIAKRFYTKLGFRSLTNVYARHKP